MGPQAGSGGSSDRPSTGRPSSFACAELLLRVLLALGPGGVAGAGVHGEVVELDGDVPGRADSSRSRRQVSVMAWLKRSHSSWPHSVGKVGAPQSVESS